MASLPCYSFTYAVLVVLGGDETQTISAFFNLCLLVNYFNSRASFSEKRMILCLIPSPLVSVRAPFIIFSPLSEIGKETQDPSGLTSSL